MKKNIYHLSHIDLDGYTCQLVMRYTPHNITNYNANYGPEVKQKLSLILEQTKTTTAPTLILITDLNLTADESRWISHEVSKQNQNAKHPIELTLLDHHGSGEESAQKHKWYYLDTTRSATKITYEYALEHFELQEPQWMKKFVEIVNAVDLWIKEEHDNFEYGKVCMRLINDARELNRVMFAKEDSLYKLSLLENATQFVGKEDAPILLDEKIHLLKKEFFRDGKKNDTLDNLVTDYVVNLLGKQKKQNTIYYKGYKGYLSFSVGNTSIIGNGFLVAFEEYDFIVDISYKGAMSIRANNKVNVAKIAKEWANGGGHPNAAGGRISGFKEQHIYAKVKAQIEQVIDMKESVAGSLEYKKEEIL